MGEGFRSCIRSLLNCVPRTFLTASSRRCALPIPIANGHITSSVFAICCQSGRLALLSEPAHGVTPPSSQFVLARLILDYRREMHWPGTVEIGTRIEHIGRSSVSLAQALFQNARCVATAQSVAVLMSTASRRACPIPVTSVHKLQRFADPERCGLGHIAHARQGHDATHISGTRPPDDV
jgi:acyl-CoA thioester hydrolase